MCVCVYVCSTDYNTGFYYFSKLSLRAIGRKFHIPEATLRAKVCGDRPDLHYNVQARPARLFTDAEEQFICNIIDDAQRRAMPMTRDLILRSVEDILQKEEDQFPR